MSVWREFDLAHNQVKRAIEPALSLDDMIAGWNEITKMLAEGSRDRKPQVSQYFLP